MFSVNWIQPPTQALVKNHLYASECGRRPREQRPEWPAEPHRGEGERLPDRISKMASQNGGFVQST